MEIDKSEWKTLKRALDEWEQSGKLTPEQVADLKKNIAFKQTGREEIAQYFFLIALFCTLLASGAIFINEKFLEKIKIYFSWNDIAIAAITLVVSVLWFGYFSKKRQHFSAAAYEVYMAAGGLCIMTSLIYFCKQAGADSTYVVFLSVAAILLAVLGIWLRSRALWAGAVIALTGWFGVFGYLHSHENLFLGMNYPLRFTVFGLSLLGIAFLQRIFRPLAFTQRITYAAGLLLLFTGLWGVSIFGNYNSLIGWHQVRQIHVIAWSGLFAAASVICFYLGIRFRDGLAKDFGVLFLLINLYTRYFEYFWDSMNKGIFFLILAIAFGTSGWMLDRRKKRKTVESLER